MLQHTVCAISHHRWIQYGLLRTGLLPTCGRNFLQACCAWSSQPFSLPSNFARIALLTTVNSMHASCGYQNRSIPCRNNENGSYGCVQHVEPLFVTWLRDPVGFVVGSYPPRHMVVPPDRSLRKHSASVSLEWVIVNI